MDKIAILDHGYLALVESWGSDEAVVTAARMSTGKGFQGWGPKHKEGCDYYPGTRTTAQCGCEEPGDENLLRYLWEHKHATPFEMAGMTIEVQAPIMVFREWHRHRIQSLVGGADTIEEMSFNEMSGRYTPLPDLNYVPTVERLMLNSKTNKQSGTVKGAAELTERDAELYRIELQNEYRAQQEMYESALSRGIPKELARIHLPVGRYSRMRASANLRNWLAFLTLRMDVAAQYEIRMYANAVGDLIAEKFPRTWALFAENISTPKV